MALYEQGLPDPANLVLAGTGAGEKSHSKCFLNQHFLCVTPFRSDQRKKKSTVEGQSTGCSVLAHLVLSHTFISSCVILLEAGNLQHSVGILHFDFAGEGNAIRSLPSDLRHRAGGDTWSRNNHQNTSFLNFKGF